MINKKGILLYSGGLDSLLSAKILLEQDIDIIGVNFILPFHSPDIDPNEFKSSRMALDIGLNLRHIRCEYEYMRMVKNPPHGYGKNMNPCIDCKIHFLKQAKKIMEEEDAAFVATGEVVGQRPMSQMKHMLNHIEKESGLRGNLLRPLSAKLLKPTLAEDKGIVDRDKLFSVNGRSRSVQMDLAEKYQITEYASPGGGCLLTDKYAAKKLKDILVLHEDYNMIDIYLLTVGRHLRLNDNAKIIVARNEKENLELEKYKEYSDYYIQPEFKGPDIFVKGILSEDDFKLISSIAGRYGKPDVGERFILINKKNSVDIKIPVNKIISDDMLEDLRI